MSKKKMNKKSALYQQILIVAQDAVCREHKLERSIVEGWSLGRLCKKIGIRYADGTAPSGNKGIKAAMHQWFEVRNKVVILPIDNSYRFGAESQHGRSKRDRQLLISAAAQAAHPVRCKDRAGHDKVNSDAFLASTEWRQLRTQALKLWGCTCQRCGATEATGAVINCDHIKPRKLYPDLALELSNIQILCSACNRTKGNWDHTDWRPTPEEFEAASERAFREMMGLAKSAYGQNF